MSKSLTENEMSSLEKVAQLRGECGRLRRAMQDALWHMGEGKPTWFNDARKTLRDALAIPFPPEGE